VEKNSKREPKKKKINTDTLVRKRKLREKNDWNCDDVLDDYTEKKKFCRVIYDYQWSY